MNALLISCMLASMLVSFAENAFNDAKERPMSQYMLILNDNPSDFADVSMAEIQKIIAEYVAWKDKIEAEGRYVGSNKLADEGGRRVAMRDGQVRVTDGPYVEAKEVLGGYFIVRAASYDEAVEIARSCPHLKYGGTIDVRLVEEVGGAASAGQ